ncbi:MAG: metallophosphoesterase [Kiritimatiellae bacterium]|nr:metallophosphoesterase [Kiritimatiellia bacterium]
MGVSRRQLIAAGSVGLLFGCRHFGEEPQSAGEKPLVRFGMVTDLHYADIPPDSKPCGPVGRRYYRQSLRKLREAVEVFNWRGVDFAIELGDFKDDSNGREGTLRHLEAIESEFARFNGPRYHVAGNHDFDCLEKDEFLSRVPNDGKVCLGGYYSFVRGGVKFVVMNACFDSKLRPYSCSNPWNDANVPPEELEWLKGELASAGRHAVVFCHQRLDDSAEPNHIVRNAAVVREIIESSGVVRAVVTGHQHCGGYHLLNGIPYYSLRALVCDSGADENSYAEMAIYPSGGFTVTGWRNAASVSRGVEPRA